MNYIIRLRDCRLCCDVSVRRLCPLVSRLKSHPTSCGKPVLADLAGLPAYLKIPLMTKNGEAENANVSIDP